MLKEFKAFLMRGNVVDLAVAVVIGAAFGVVVTSLVDGILMPLIGAIVGEPDFSGIGFEIRDSKFEIGLVLNALFAFIAVAAAIFFFVVKPMNMMMARGKKPVDPTSKNCPYCLMEVPVAATRCGHCTSELG